MIIDAKNLVLGRVATVAAKKALQGIRVDIVNCEKAVITGNREQILKMYKHESDRGTHSRGPFMPKMADRFVKRAIRGMLPYKKAMGRKAFDSIKCHIGIPAGMKEQKAESMENIDVSKKQGVDFATVKEICNHLGGRK